MDVDRVELSRAYDTSVVLMAIADTICPEFLEKDMQTLIEKCFSVLPQKMEVVVYEKE